MSKWIVAHIRISEWSKHIKENWYYLKSQIVSVQILALPFAGWVTLDKLFNLSKAQLHFSKIRITIRLISNSSLDWERQFQLTSCDRHHEAHKALSTVPGKQWACVHFYKKVTILWTRQNPDILTNFFVPLPTFIVLKLFRCFVLTNYIRSS